jgi:hypothetical protein
VQALGLVEVYDQFDTSGAQVENGYDLSPLFHRLAVLAPVDKPGAQLRTRRSRTVGLQETASRGVASTTFVDAVAVVPLQDPSCTLAKEHSPAPCNGDHSPPATLISRPTQLPSGLKVEEKNRLKRQTRTDQQPAVAVAVCDAPPEVADRLTDDLPRHEIARSSISIPHTNKIERSRDVLARIGLNPRVIDAVAPTLQAAHAWALWAYARLAGLGPGWIATQVYDFASQGPRDVMLPRRFVDAGQLLAGLAPDVAESLIDIIDRDSPNTAAGVDDCPQDPAAGPAQRAALNALWTLRAELSIRARGPVWQHDRLRIRRGRVQHTNTQLGVQCAIEWRA